MPMRADEKAKSSMLFLAVGSLPLKGGALKFRFKGRNGTLASPGTGGLGRLMTFLRPTGLPFSTAEQPQ